MLIGRDPRDIEHDLQIMNRHGYCRMGIIGISAICGIELALWDILGKSRPPVWRLLGGRVRDTVRTYTHLGLGDMRAVYETPRGSHSGEGAAGEQRLRRAQGRLHPLRPHVSSAADGAASR